MGNIVDKTIDMYVGRFIMGSKAPFKVVGRVYLSLVLPEYIKDKIIRNYSGRFAGEINRETPECPPLGSLELYDLLTAEGKNT